MDETEAKTVKIKRKKLDRRGKSLTGKPLDKIDLDPELDDELDTGTVDEAILNVQQRRKRGISARKNKAKLTRARKIAAKRLAPTDKLQRRAMRKARTMIRKRVAGERGAKYAELTPAAKISVDKAVERRKKAIGKIAKRIFPKVKAAEFERLKSYMSGSPLKNLPTPGKQGAIKEDNELVYQVMSDLIEHMLEPKQQRSLMRKSDRSGINYNTLEEVFVRGMYDSDGDYQAAFERVNCFISGGKSALSEDYDLYQIRHNTTDTLFEERFIQNEPKANPHIKNQLRTEDVDESFSMFFEVVKTADKQPVVVPSHTDAYGNQIPAKTVMRKRNHKIIKSGNVHDGDPKDE